MAGSRTKPKGGYTRADWFPDLDDQAEGMVMDGFCMKHHSFWCPCAAPGLYDPKKRKMSSSPDPTLQFRSISASDMQKIRTEAARREQQKRGYASTRGWASGGNTHLPGLVGELVFGRVIGKEPDWELRAAGDDGTDFDGVDVKCSTFLPDPDLKMPQGDLRKKKRSPFYALVVWNQEAGTAAYAGWATRAEVEAAPVKDYGYGPTVALNWRVLHAGVPS